MAVKVIRRPKQESINRRARPRPLLGYQAADIEADECLTNALTPIGIKAPNPRTLHITKGCATPFQPAHAAVRLPICLELLLLKRSNNAEAVRDSVCAANRLNFNGTAVSDCGMKHLKRQSNATG